VTSEGVEVAAVRDAQTIRAEIEQARDQLAVSVDQLADRLAPARLMSEAKASAKAKATSPAAIAIASGVTALLAVIVVRNLRRSRR
jgi:F0F1-type ATP synthase membrane subunit b/b'